MSASYVFSVTTKSKPTNWLPIILIVTVLVIIAVGIFAIWRWRKMPVAQS